MKLLPEIVMSRILTPVIALILTAGLLVTGCSSASQPDGPGEAPQVGKLAPDFRLSGLDGQSVSLKDFRGRPVLVNFWASWCGPCVYEMPFIEEVYKEWSGKGLGVLAINIGESRSQALGFVESNRLSFPVLLDRDGKVAEQYNVRNIPTTIFVDKEGIIQVIKIGTFPNKAAIEDNLSKVVP